VGRTSDLDGFPRTPEDVSACAPFTPVPERAIATHSKAKLAIAARRSPLAARRSPLAAAAGSTLARIGSQFVALVNQPSVRLRSAGAVPGVARSCRGAAAFSMDMQPNAELTGRRRMGALPARRRIDSERFAGKVASRWRSG